MGIYLKQYHQENPPLGSQINWGHPLSQGLVGCWLMNERGGKRLNDLAFNNNLAIAQPDWKGGNLNFDGNSQNLYKSSLNYKLNSYISFVFNLKTTLTTLQSLCTYNRNSGNFENVFALVISNNTNGKLTFWDYSNGFHYNNLFDSNFVYNDGKLNNVAFTKNKLVGKYYKNGIFDIQQSSDADVVYGNTDFVIGYNLRDVTNYLNGLITYFYIFKRVLTHNEIKSFSEAPYQFIQPIRRRFYSLPAGIAAPPPVNEATQFIMVS